MDLKDFEFYNGLNLTFWIEDTTDNISLSFVPVSYLIHRVVFYQLDYVLNKLQEKPPFHRLSINPSVIPKYKCSNVADYFCIPPSCSLHTSV